MTDFHVMMMGSRAAGGFRLVFPEQIAIASDGRTSTSGAGIYADAQMEGFSRVAAIVKDMNAVQGVLPFRQKSSTRGRQFQRRLIQARRLEIASWRRLRASCMRDSGTDRLSPHRANVGRQEEREERMARETVRAGLIGAGKFGMMFLAQAPTTDGLEVVAIADLDLERARASCHAAGWDESRITRTTFLDSGTALAEVELDVVVEATGSPLAGIRHARAAFARRRHVRNGDCGGGCPRRPTAPA